MKEGFLCPHCASALVRGEHAYACGAGHSYDIARAGYVNLLAGKPPAVGDNREMIAARRRTLERGVYAPLRAAVAEAAELAPHGTLLDAGCGEGYYTEALEVGRESFGVDISKDALKQAAKRLTHTELAVASVYRLPFRENAFSLISCIFSPLAEEEYHRVLAPGGTLLLVIPGPRHLFEMKTILYETPYENEVSPYDSLAGFRFLREREVGFRFLLTGQEAILDLFAMTPYYYRTPRAGRERLASLERLEIGADFRVLSYRRE